MRVTAYSLDMMIALTDGGEQLPITNLFSADGDDCEPADAVVFVCGTDASGWFSERLADFHSRGSH